MKAQRVPEEAVLRQSNNRPARRGARDTWILCAVSLATFIFLLLSEPFTGRFLPGDEAFSLSPDEIVTLLLIASVANYIFLARRRNSAHGATSPDLREIHERLRDAQARHRGLAE